LWCTETYTMRVFIGSPVQSLFLMLKAILLVDCRL